MNIQLQLFTSPVPPAVLVTQMVSYQGPVDVYCWYEGTRCLPAAGAENSLEMLLEEVHQCVALPSVAGHPTGGAIDLTIALGVQELDMGCAIADFSDLLKLPTYSSLVTADQSSNRRLLHDLMLAEGFAPFYGEWWHFSYGDREWAAFYSQPNTLYSPIYQT